MEFKIEKNALARRDYLAHEGRTFCREELAPNLEHSDKPAQALDERERALAIRDIERNYQPVFRAYLIRVDVHTERLALDHKHRRFLDYSRSKMMIQVPAASSNEHRKVKRRRTLAAPQPRETFCLRL